MKIDLKENPDALKYIIREFPLKYSFVGEDEGSDSFKIFIKQNTLKEIDDYLSSDLQNELGGVLLGDICVDSSGQKFIFIDNLIIAKHSNSSLSRLTFTHDTWDYINQIHEEDYPDRKILGWFHSHPGHTVFLSNYDIFIQENFFNMEYMVAYVFDPTIKERGFFHWEDKKIVKSGGYYIADYIKEIADEELLPDSQKLNEEIKSTKPKIVFTGIKSLFTGKVLIGLLFLALIVLIFMIYNIYEIRQKAILKDEYLNELEEIKNENKILTERLNILIAESEQRNGISSGNPLTESEFTENKKEENFEVSKSDKESKLDVSQMKKGTSGQNTEKLTDGNSNNQEMNVYQVKKGDTLEKISLQFYKSIAGIDVILKQNNLKNKTDIKIGQQLLIPVSLQ